MSLLFYYHGPEYIPKNECNYVVYLCLKQKRNFFPIDIMEIINSFLHWLPARLWEKNKSKCIECNIICLDSKQYCSWNCYEKQCRLSIINQYIQFANNIEYIDKVFDLINKFTDDISDSSDDE